MIFHASKRLYGHIDCNCFFVSCEILRDPSLRGKCVVVGGDIIVASSYEARKYGVQVGTPIWEATQLLGKALIHIYPDLGYYRRISEEFMLFLSGKVLSIEPFSIDEAFVDITGLPEREFEGNILQYAKSLKQEILQKIGIPVSIGISNTRIKAKMFADIHKPFGEFIGLDRDEEREVFQMLPVRSIPFIGRGLANRLGKSIKTVEDFRKLGFFSLDRLIGKNATTLWLELHGVDVWKMSYTEGKQKSILRSRSFNHAMTDNKHVLWRHFLENFEKAYDELVSLECESLSISVLLRSKELLQYMETHVFDTPTVDKHVFLKTAKALLETIFNPGIMYRSTGVIFSNLSPANPKQLSVFEYDNVTNERNVKLQKTIHQIQNRYGRSLIKLGRL